MYITTYGCAMVQPVSCFEGLGSIGISMCICVGEIVTGTGFIQLLHLSSTTLKYTMLHSYSFIYHQHLAVEDTIKQLNSTLITYQLV